MMSMYGSMLRWKKQHRRAKASEQTLLLHFPDRDYITQIYTEVHGILFSVWYRALTIKILVS